MTNKTKLALRGFFDLSQSERQEFIDKVNEFLKSPDADERRLLREGIEKQAEKIMTGPLDSGGCPCCGR